MAKNEKIMVSRTLSKSYALAGLRFGYLVAQPHLIEQFVKVKDSYNCDSLSIAAATAAIGDRAWLGQTREKILRSRGRLVTALRDIGFIVPDSQANFVWAVHERQERPADVRRTETPADPRPIHGCIPAGATACGSPSARTRRLGRAWSTAGDRVED